jgi:RimJ/RimL family protein N-acetyltransferase
MNSKRNDQYKPVIELRPWAEGDLFLLQRLLGDPSMTEHLGGPESMEKIQNRHERYCRDSIAGKDPMFVIVLSDGNISAGSIGYWEKEWKGQFVWETGWSILPEFQGMGIASKAASLVIERARKEEKFQFVHAFPSIHNPPSNAVCRTAGFVLQGEVNFEYPPGNMMRCNDWRFELSRSIDMDL